MKPVVCESWTGSNWIIILNCWMWTWNKRHYEWFVILFSLAYSLTRVSHFVSLSHSRSLLPDPLFSFPLFLSLAFSSSLSLSLPLSSPLFLKRSLRCGTWEQSPPLGGQSPHHRPSTLIDTRPMCFEVEKQALRLGASAHYIPTNLGPSPLRTGFP